MPINCSRPTAAIVSEVWLSAGADGKVISDPPVVSEAGKHYPLYSYDDSDVFEGQSRCDRPDLSFRGTNAPLSSCCKISKVSLLG